MLSLFYSYSKMFLFFFNYSNQLIIILHQNGQFKKFKKISCNTDYEFANLIDNKLFSSLIRAQDFLNYFLRLF